MYAIVRLKGKQYRTSPGDTLKVDKIDKKVGESIAIEEILTFYDGKKHFFGTPYLKNMTLQAEVVDHGKDKKIVVYTYRRRKGYHRKLHHRQQYSLVKVGDVQKK